MEMKTSVEEQYGKVDRTALQIKVQQMYRRVALRPDGKFHFEMGRALADRLGYSPDLLDRVPIEAIRSFAGVGHHFHLANITEGESIVDLGSGAGMDTFIAALLTGASGKVTGIDMTEEQLHKAQLLRDRYHFRQVHFLESFIEALPLQKNTADVVISNGVINLSAAKELVFREATRILKPGGRFVLSDIVSGMDPPEKISCDANLWAACIGGAVTIEKYTEYIEQAGMKIVIVEDNPQYAFLSENAQGAAKKYGIKSISLLAVKR